MTWISLYILLAWAIRLSFVLVILRRQMAPGASVAWLGVVFLHPYIGLSLYALVGETRLGRKRVRRHRELVTQLRAAARGADPHRLARLRVAGPYESMVLQAEKVSGMPILGGNKIEFLGGPPRSAADEPAGGDMIDRLVADIDAATSHVHLLYYLFAPDGTGRRVADALGRAAGRGVRCRVLADAVASRAFFRRRGLARPLAAAGVEVAAAMPVAPTVRGLPRMDLRNHRKLAVIDGRVAYAGSQNLIDADYGGRRGAPWVDLTARFTGPILGQFATVFAEDWAFETGAIPEGPPPPGAGCGGAANHATGAEAPETPETPETPGAGEGTPMQVVPTGPTSPGESFRRLFLAAVQSARSRLVLTTPYFVPDEPTLVSLVMAADRGVDVSLVLPRVPDHRLTAAAGRAHFARLLSAGVSLYLYRPGLIHAKTATVDDAFALLGSANIDVRSFNLNFELTVLLYGPEVTRRLRAIQSGYITQSLHLDAARWSARPAVWRYADSAVSLLSPLL